MNTLRKVLDKYARLAKGPSNIKVKNPGILEIPEGKTFLSMPVGHFVALAKRKGPGPVQRAISNLIRWNGEDSRIGVKAKQIREAIKSKVTEGE